MSIFSKEGKGLKGSFGRKDIAVEAALASGDTAALARFLNEMKPAGKKPAQGSKARPGYI